MNTQEIKEMILNGQQFSNEQADWYTLSSPENDRRIIVIGGEYRFYKTLNSYAKRISQLIKRGY